MSARISGSVALLLCFACGGQAHETSASAGANAIGGTGGSSDTGAGGGASMQGGACSSAAIPEAHRASAQACPSERGTTPLLDMTSCTDRSGIACTKDADCTAGKNGRCYQNGDRCQTICSYDDCSTDADCGAGVCYCRSSGSDTIANECLTGGNCRTDADCGNCQYCSPSVVPNAVCNGSCSCNGVATITYTCHTASDQCTDPIDCAGSNQYCGYDASAQRWACQFCVGISPPHP